MLTPGGVGKVDIVVQYKSVIEVVDEPERDLRADELWQVVLQQRCFDLSSET